MKSLVKAAFNMLGVDVARADKYRLDHIRLVHLLNSTGFKLVIDVGANVGQFGEQLFRAGYLGHVISFEPLPDAHTELCKRARLHKKWSVAERMALGDTNGSVPFFVAGNSVSSSMLSMLETHSREAPGSVTIGSFPVEVQRLDTVLPKIVPVGAELFLKIDTQGAEAAVLAGADGIMHQIRGVKLELSLVELYSGQELYRELDETLRQLGFYLWDIVPGFRSPQTARLLQMDGVYLRRDVSF